MPWPNPSILPLFIIYVQCLSTTLNQALDTLYEVHLNMRDPSHDGTISDHARCHQEPKKGPGSQVLKFSLTKKEYSDIIASG